MSLEQRLDKIEKIWAEKQKSPRNLKVYNCGVCSKKFKTDLIPVCDDCFKKIVKLSLPIRGDK